MFLKHIVAFIDSRKYLCTPLLHATTRHPPSLPQNSALKGSTEHPLAAKLGLPCRGFTLDSSDVITSSSAFNGLESCKDSRDVR